MDNRTAGRIRVTYVLTCAAGEDPLAKARDIAFEQTVELPPECVESDIVDRVVGRDVLQLFNLLFGNISLKNGVLVTRLELPPSVLRHFLGPRHGVEGLRSLCAVSSRRPLSCVAVKPLGSSAAELADRCGGLALGGIDIVKDDHGIADQPPAPFEERVSRCQEAVSTANDRTGGADVSLTDGRGPLLLSPQVGRLRSSRTQPPPKRQCRGGFFINGRWSGPSTGAGGSTGGGHEASFSDT